MNEQKSGFFPTVKHDFIVVISLAQLKVRRNFEKDSNEMHHNFARSERSHGQESVMVR